MDADDLSGNFTIYGVGLGHASTGQWVRAADGDHDPFRASACSVTPALPA